MGGAKPSDRRRALGWESVPSPSQARETGTDGSRAVQLRRPRGPGQHGPDETTASARAILCRAGEEAVTVIGTLQSAPVIPWPADPGAINRRPVAPPCRLLSPTFTARPDRNGSTSDNRPKQRRQFRTEHGTTQ